MPDCKKDGCSFCGGCCEDDCYWFHNGMEMTIVGVIEAVIIYVSGAALRVAA